MPDSDLTTIEKEIDRLSIEQKVKLVEYILREINQTPIRNQTTEKSKIGKTLDSEKAFTYGCLQDHPFFMSDDFDDTPLDFVDKIG